MTNPHRLRSNVVTDWSTRRAPTVWTQPQLAAARESRSGRLLIWSSFLHAAGLLTIVAADQWFSERHWIAEILTFAPRQPFLITAVVMTIAAVWYSRGLVLLNALMIVVAAGPVMHFTTAADSGPPTAAAEGTSLKVVSCNVQGFEGDATQLVMEIMRLNPDVIALQETRAEPEILRRAIPDWQIEWRSEFWIASRYPMRWVAMCPSSSFERSVALTVEIEAPQQTLRLTNIHLTTPRYGLREIHPASLMDGSGPEALQAHTRLRAAEVSAAAKYLTEVPQGLPHIVCGDFNMPTFSHFYRENFAAYRNAFEEVSWGYGYTTPCNTSRLWPGNVPWVRIDHILATRDCRIESCRIGQSDASDHRLISSRIRLPATLGVGLQQEVREEKSSNNSPDRKFPTDLTSQSE